MTVYLEHKAEIVNDVNLYKIYDAGQNLNPGMLYLGNAGSDVQ